MQGMIRIILFNICTLAAILVRHLRFQNLYFDCGVCEVQYVLY